MVQLGRRGNECRINGIIHFRNATQRVPPVLNNGIRLGDKIPIARRHAVPLNATHASQQHCGSPSFCPVRARTFSREDRADHLYHQKAQ
jgi:hypothetical protein